MKKMRRANGPPHGFKEREVLLAVFLLIALLVLLLILALVLVLVLILVALILVIFAVLHRKYLLSIHWVQVYFHHAGGKYSLKIRKNGVDKGESG